MQTKSGTVIELFERVIIVYSGVRDLAVSFRSYISKYSPVSNNESPSSLNCWLERVHRKLNHSNNI